MQETKSMRGWGLAYEVVRIVVAIALAILVVGVWACLWVPPF